MEYSDFLNSKILVSEMSGFDVSPDELHPSTKDHQRDSIIWGLKGGRRALFLQFGLGKTHIQIEMARLAHKKENARCLLICPLGVKQEFTQKDGPRLGVDIEYVRTNAEVLASDNPILITNYERVRDGDIDVNQFYFVSLDEAAILRGYGTKTYQAFLQKFDKVKYRFVCTACPSPNRYKELIHYAGFLGIMDTGQALTRFFQRDSTQANNLTLYPHMEQEFWLWVSTWALFLTKPSDLGYSDEGYDLPKLNIQYHKIAIDHSKVQAYDSWGNQHLFRDSAMGLKEAAKEKRYTLIERLEKTKEIINGDDPEKHWIIWHHLEDERKAIEKEIPEAQSVFGSQDLEKRENLIIGFSNGNYRILATKPEIAGSGCNFQRFCSDAIFMGINYGFEDFIQAVHRIYRFLQTKEVNIHIVYAESETSVLKTLQTKWENHDKLLDNMREIILKYGLNHSEIKESLSRSIGTNRKEVKGEYYTSVHNDCVEETKLMEADSVDLIHTSIPFSNHYEYTPSYNDFGHNSGDDAFFRQMDFLVPELHRILKPGRVAAIHVKDRIMFGNVTGYGMPSVNPFSDKTTACFQRHGFIFFGRITVVTDVVRENNQTYRLGWSENCKDGTKMGVGMSEYILLFRKLPTDTSKGYADDPVTKSKEDYNRSQWQIDAHGYWRSSGNRLISPDELSEMEMNRIQDYYKAYSAQNIYDYKAHVELGTELEKKGKLPASFMLFAPTSHNENVWDDVNRMRTLNTVQSQRREQNHVCPLQFDIVERIIQRYTNEGELVFDPFGGLMTVPYCAIKLNRRGYGVELNEDYWNYGNHYCRDAEYKKIVPTLFDAVEEKEAV